MKQMHIAIIGDYPYDLNKISGGVEAVVFYLSRALQEHDHIQISVVSLAKRSEEGKRIDLNGISIRYLPQSRLPSRFSEIINIRNVLREIKSINPDIVHAHIAGIYSHAAEQNGTPYVLTLHGIRYLEANLWEKFISRKYRGWIIKKDEFRAIKKAKHIISISPFIDETFRGQISGNLYHIDNPVDERMFSVKKKCQNGRLLFVGRLIHRKGVKTLLKAFHLLHHRRPEVVLYIVGGGISNNDSLQYVNELKKYVHDKGLTGSVMFLGELKRKALMQEYEKCSVLVLSSLLETAPIVIMEAMATGTPVVTTDVGGARYLVEHGKTGWVVKPNQPEQLSEALYLAINDAGKTALMGEAARKEAKIRFSSSIVAAKTINVYNKILF